MKRRTIAVIAAAVGLWAVIVWWAVPSVIADAYAGKSLALFNRLLSGRATTPLADYLATWQTLALTVTAIILAIGLAAYRLTPYIRRLPKPLRASFAGLPAAGVGGAVWFAAFIGMVVGIAEAINGLIRNKIQHLPTGEVVSGELVWMVPTIASVTFVLIALLLATLDRALRARQAVVALAAPLVVGLGAYSFMRALAVGLKTYAAVFLALGLAVVTVRALTDHALFMKRFVRRAAPVLALMLIVWAFVVPLRRSVREARAVATRRAAPVARPNVILLIWDAVRARNLSAYGYHRATTPTLERLARQGVLFERAYATSAWTLPSHASMFTGRYAHELTTRYHTKLDETYPTIGETLAKHGYATAGFTGNLFYGTASYGIARGFDVYDDRAPIRPLTILHTWWLSRTVAQDIRLRSGNHQDMMRRNATHVRRALVRWIKDQDDRPFFAAVNWFDAHDPYVPPAPFDRAFSKTSVRVDVPTMRLAAGARAVPMPLITPKLQRSLITAYDGCVRYLDHELELLVEQLRAMGKLDNTMLIVTADHGEMFGEEYRYLSRHGRSLFPSVLHVPLVLYYPAKLPQNMRREETVSIRDLPATIMSVVGLVDQNPFPGTSLTRYIDGSATERERSEPRLAATHAQKRSWRLSRWPAAYGDQFAVIDRNMEYILDGTGREHLYDIALDYHAQRNLAGDPKARSIVARYRAILDSQIPSKNGRRYAAAAALER